MASPAYARGWLHFAVLAFVIASAGPSSADYRQDVGFLQLAGELTTALPTGAGVSLAQVEARDLTGAYLPVTTGGLLDAKAFAIQSGSSGVSYHATQVGSHLYGTASMSPGITSIDVFMSYDWRVKALKVGTTQEPAPTDYRLFNASFISTAATPAKDIEACRRFDYVVHRDGVVAVVGTANEQTAALPGLMTHAYNVLTVGVSSGLHTHGYTTFDGVGRIKPDIVAPSGATSYATPMVTSAAALLLETADRDDSLAAARTHGEVIRAVLMAGASKAERFADWDRTPQRPLDGRYGAGELNVYNSYQILTAGEQSANSGTAAPAGWDYALTTRGSNVYYLEVPLGKQATLSASLNWNRIVTSGLSLPGQWGSPQSNLANLDLRLAESDARGLMAVLDESVSAVDNVETIYQRSLLPGRYALEVRGDQADVAYALAWQTTLQEVATGDANGDGVIDFVDFLALETSYGRVGRWSQGDFNGDGYVGQADYLLLQAQYEMQDSASAIPEPTALALLAAWGLMLRRRR